MTWTLILSLSLSVLSCVQCVCSLASEISDPIRSWNGILQSLEGSQKGYRCSPLSGPTRACATIALIAIHDVAVGFTYYQYYILAVLPTSGVSTAQDDHSSQLLVPEGQCLPSFHLFCHLHHRNGKTYIVKLHLHIP